MPRSFLCDKFRTVARTFSGTSRTLMHWPMTRNWIQNTGIWSFLTGGFACWNRFITPNHALINIGWCNMNGGWSKSWASHLQDSLTRVFLFIASELRVWKSVWFWRDFFKRDLCYFYDMHGFPLFGDLKGSTEAFNIAVLPTFLRSNVRKLR